MKTQKYNIKPRKDVHKNEWDAYFKKDNYLIKINPMTGMKASVRTLDKQEANLWVYDFYERHQVLVQKFNIDICH